VIFVSNMYVRIINFRGLPNSVSQAMAGTLFESPYPNPPICPLNLQFNISLPLELTPEEHKGNLSALLHHLNRQHLPIVNAMA
jgi:hypothetical protein